MDSRKIFKLFQEVPRLILESKASQITIQALLAQALHGLAPNRKLINVHELVKMSKNRYITLLQLENGNNFNTKARIYKKWEYLVYILLHIRDTSSNFKLRSAALSNKKIDGFVASSGCQSYLSSRHNRILDQIYAN